VQLRDLWQGPVSSEEELGALLERIRKAGEHVLSEGKWFFLT
jgi:hypothetical protein